MQVRNASPFPCQTIRLSSSFIRITTVSGLLAASILFIDSCGLYFVAELKPMKRQLLNTLFCSALLTTFSITISAQGLSKGSLNGSVSAGFYKPITPEYFVNNTPLMLNGKVGWFLKNRFSISLEANITRYEAPYYQIAALQGPSGTYYEKGEKKDNSFSIGITAGKYFPLSSKFFLSANLYAHHLHNRYKEKGVLVRENGEDAGIRSNLTVDYNYAGRVGLNTEINYFITPHLAGIFRPAQLDLKLRRGWRTQLYAEAPLLLGISYHLKP